jgi:hypothetical protein
MSRLKQPRSLTARVEIRKHRFGMKGTTIQEDAARFWGCCCHDACSKQSVSAEYGRIRSPLSDRELSSGTAIPTIDLQYLIIIN